MTRRLLIALLGLLLPLSGQAATFAGNDTGLTLSESVPDNAYLGGSSVTVTADLPADLTAAAGTVGVYAPIAGDVLTAAGTLIIERPIAGDVRAAVGSLHLSGDVGGDVAVIAGTAVVTGKAREIYIIGSHIEVTGGASGPVTIYGADVTLAGDFAGDIEVIASDRFVIKEGTHVAGTLRYNAPEAVQVPPSAVVDGGVTYTGSYAYVPTKEEARKFALAGAGVFLIVRATAGMIVAGLLVGLFPGIAGRITGLALRSGGKRAGLFGLLGFALFLATPVLTLLLLLSFVGAGVAFILGILYLLLLMLSYAYAGVIAGAALRKHAFSRLTDDHEVTWRDAVLGVLVLNVISIVPGIGSLVKFLLAAVAAGIIVTLAYRYAFRAGDTPV